MHILIADILESQKCTALLHQIMNRLGVCALADTLSWFVQSTVEKENENIGSVHRLCLTM